VKHYINDIQLFRRIVDRPFREVTRLDIDRFVEEQLERKLSATTVNRRLASLHHFFEFLADEAEDDTWANPVAWRRHRVREGKLLPRDVSDMKVEQFFTYVDQPRDRLMFSLMCQIGLRVGEVAALQVADLIRTDKPGAGMRLRVRGKGQKERVVPLTAELVHLWDEWLVQRPQVASDAVFVTRRKKGISVRGIQDRLKHYCQQAGVQFTCHQLRHTFGRRMAEGEMPLPSLSKLLGHAQITTTQNYISGAAVKVRADYQAAMDRLQAQESGLSLPFAIPSQAKSPKDKKENESASQKQEEGSMDLSRFWVNLPDWLTEQLEEYIIYQQHRWKPSQVRHHTRTRLQTLVQVWRWLVAEREVNEIAALKRQDMQAYINVRLETGLAASTLNRELRDLWAFLSFVEDRGQAVSPGVFRIARLKEKKALPRYLDDEAYRRLERRLLAEMEDDSRDASLDLAWFYLLAHAGLRLGELCDLQLGDFDWLGRRLAVREGKGKRDRVVPLSTTVCQMVNNYLAVRGPAQTDHLLIFRQKQIRPELVQTRLRRHGAAVGVEVSPHRLRHTLATRLVNGGMEITSLQRLLGHEKLDTTMIYAHVHDSTMEQDFRQAIAGLENNREQLPIPVLPATGSLAEDLFSHTRESIPVPTQVSNYV
jgi:site-specific recombinase XerD